MPTLFFWTRLGCFSLFLLLPIAAALAEKVGTATEEATDTPTALAKRFPVLDTDAVTCPQFDATGRVRLDNGGYQLTVRYRRPGVFETLAVDTSDNSPFVVCQARTLYIFEPVTPQFVVTPKMKMQWNLAGGRGNACNFDFKFDTNKNFADRVYIDIPSMLVSSLGDLLDDGTTDDALRLVHVAKKDGKRLTAELQHRLAIPVCTLRLIDPETPEPRAVITLTLHSTGTEPLVQPPTQDALASVLPVHRPPENADASDFLKTLTLSWRGLSGHFGVWDAAMRETFPVAGAGEVEWAAIADNKRQHGEAIRELFSIALPLNPDDQPITPQMAADEAVPVQ